MYLDSTLFAKLYVKEPDSELAIKFVGAAYQRPACSVLGMMEILSTFHRKLWEGEITSAVLKTIHLQFETDVFNEQIEWLRLTDSIIEDVQRAFVHLPANIFLRTGDAIHLATAAQAGLNEIYSNDGHLLAAARLFKLKGVNPLGKS